MQKVKNIKKIKFFILIKHFLSKKKKIYTIKILKKSLSITTQFDKNQIP